MNVSSVHGRMAVVKGASYTCTKHAIEAFSDILRREMARFGVKVSIIEPGHFGAATALCGKEMVNFYDRYKIQDTRYKKFYFTSVFI